MTRVLIAVLFAVISIPTWAHGPYRGGGYYRGSNWSWVAPAVIGGAMVYSITRPIYVYPPPPVVYAPPSAPAPWGYHYEQVLDAHCNCVRWILVFD